MTDPHAPLRDRLLPLPGVITRRMFGSEAFFVGPAMFAFFTPTALVVRLSPTVLNESVTSGRGRPFLSFGASHLNGWAEVPLSGTTGRGSNAWRSRPTRPACTRPGAPPGASDRPGPGGW